MNFPLITEAVRICSRRLFYYYIWIDLCELSAFVTYIIYDIYLNEFLPHRQCLYLILTLLWVPKDQVWYSGRSVWDTHLWVQPESLKTIVRSDSYHKKYKLAENFTTRKNCGKLFIRILCVSMLKLPPP